MGARENILDAADRIFGEIGFDAASTREIAEASGVNKALIHYHFTSKDGLLASVLDKYYEKLTKEVSTVLGGAGSFREIVLKLADSYADFLSRNMSFCRIVQREASGGKHAESIRQRMIPMYAMGKKMIEKKYPGLDGALAAEQLMVSIYGMIITYFTYSDVLEPLMGSPPMNDENLTRRKEHIRYMIGITLDRLDEGGR